MISPERAAAIEAHATAMERAHRMSCSDPSDPARKTTYGDSAAAIRDLLAELREKDEQLAAAAADVHDAWDVGCIHGHNAEGRLIDKRAENPHPAAPVAPVPPLTVQGTPGAPGDLEGATAILAGHQFNAKDGSCSCKRMFYDTRRAPNLVLVEHFLHVEVELHIAGYGDMAAAADKARKDAAETLRSWYEDRMDDDPDESVDVPDYDKGQHVGVTEGILAAALSVHPEGGSPRSDEARAEARATLRADRRRRRAERAAEPVPDGPAPTWPPDPDWGTDRHGRFRYTDYDGESLIIWQDPDGGRWVDKRGEGPVFIREQDSPIITEQLTKPQRSPRGD